MLARQSVIVEWIAVNSALMEDAMYVVAAVLAVLTGLFYIAGNHEMGSLGVQMCQYGGVFCDRPVYVLAGAILAAVWGGFVSIR